MSEGERTRQTADERREEVLRAAIDEFAMYGYHGGTTRRIAAQVGISQPYVQHLYGSKSALFLAALDRVCEDIIAAWKRELYRFRVRSNGKGTAEERLHALRPGYERFVGEVVGLRLVLQASAASGDPEIRRHLKANMKRMFDWVRESTGASYEDVQTFWAHGMMLTIAASIGAAEDAGTDEWARAMLMMPDISTPEAEAKLPT